MKLFLVQHARAASKEVDPERPLTEEGRRDMEKIMVFIKPLELAVDFLWHSGKTRARQTAEILAQVVTIDNELNAHNGLAPNDDVEVIKEEIEAARQDFMIVSHLPFVDKLASLLFTGSESASIVAFKQGGIVCLSCENHNLWQIEWMITPDLLACPAPEQYKA
jgi:phosphohistidine phosphatase